MFLFNNKIFLEAKEDLINFYKLIKKNKKHNDLFYLPLNKRLLRTKKNSNSTSSHQLIINYKLL